MFFKRMQYRRETSGSYSLDKSAENVIGKWTIISPEWRSRFPFTGLYATAKGDSEKRPKRARENRGGRGRKRRGRDRYKSGSTCTTTTRHMPGKHSARERISPYWFSLESLSLSASLSAGRSFSLVRSPRLFCPAIKARAISIFDSCSTKRSPRSYIYTYISVCKRHTYVWYVL